MARWNSIRASYEHLRTDVLDQCISCGICVDVCPVYRVADWSGRSASQLHDERLAVLRGERPSDAVYKFTFACSRCGKCKDVCPVNLNTLELTYLMRSAVVEAGGLAPDNVSLPGDPRNLNNVCAALLTKPSDVRWMTRVEDDVQRSDIVLFLGCAVMGMPDKVHALLDVLDLLGLSIPVVGGGQLCCGIVHSVLADVAGAERQLRDLVGALAKFRPKKAVFWCTGCYGKMQATAPHIMDLPFESQHIASFLYDHVDRLPFRRLDKRVAVHDSCTGRALREYEPVRRLLGAIPGLELVEMANNRGDVYCCGAAIQAQLPDVATSFTDLVMGQARDGRVSTLATLCPGCQRRFGRQDHRQPFVVESFITVVGEALGIRYQDGLKRFQQYQDPERVIAESGERIAASGYQPGDLENLIRKYF